VGTFSFVFIFDFNFIICFDYLYCFLCAFNGFFVLFSYYFLKFYKRVIIRGEKALLFISVLDLLGVFLLGVFLGSFWVFVFEIRFINGCSFLFFYDTK